MKSLKYIVYKEDKYYVSQCLNVDVSSFGSTLQEAVDNLNEALELYFDEKKLSQTFLNISETMIGETYINV
ncbi:MAG: type II toxin-antitoxin system HicB family antitoxin [Promethearchaeota archaeon]